MKKTLKIYRDEKNNEFVIERINEFNHSWKRSFITEEALKEGLEAYEPVMDQYTLEVSDSCWPILFTQKPFKN